MAPVRARPVARVAAMALGLLLVGLALLFKRPASAPQVANLDSAWEMADAWLQLRDGLELRGQFSWSAWTYHPGPTYEWTLALGGAVARALDPTWFAYGTWLALVLAALVFYAAAWWCLERVVGWVPATAALGVLAAWQAWAGEGPWDDRTILVQMLFAPALTPALASAAVAGAWAGARGWAPGLGLAGLASGLLAGNHLTTVPLGALIAAVAVMAAFQARSRRQWYWLAAGVSLGWWWLPVRSLLHGPLFWLPEFTHGPTQAGPWPTPATIELKWADVIAETHTALPLWALCVVLAAVTYLVFRSRHRLGAPLSVLTIGVFALGILLMCLWPQRYSGYQTMWVEPLWWGGIGVLLGFAAMRATRFAGLLVVSLTLASGVWFLSSPGVLDASNALEESWDPVPVEQLDGVVGASQALGLPVVVSVGMDPERHAPVLLYLQQRGVPMCQADPFDLSIAPGPMEREKCTSAQLAERAVWVTTEDGNPSRPPFAADPSEWPHPFRYAGQWTTWVPQPTRDES